MDVGGLIVQRGKYRKKEIKAKKTVMRNRVGNYSYELVMLIKN